MSSSGSKTSSLKREIGDLLVEAERREYDRLISLWENLEAKAQAVGGLAGVFVAAAFAFVRNLPSGVQLSSTDKGVLVAAVVLLVISVGASLRVQWVRKVATSPNTELLENRAEVISSFVEENDDVSADDAQYMVRHKWADAWSSTSRDIASKAKQKACWLVASQVSLALAIACVALVAVGTLV